MKLRQKLLAAMVGMWATSALAHSPLETTNPGDEAVLKEAPAEIQLGFQGKIRLTKVTMIHQEQSGADLDLSGLDGFLSDFSIPFEGGGDGEYLIEWRGLGDDGHVMNGSFRFFVK